MVQVLLALAVLSAPPAGAAPDDSRAVVAAVQEFFDALAAKDEARLMASVVADGRISAQRSRDGKVQLRTQGWAEWAKSVAASKEALEERMHDPEVRISGTIASVWTYYTFRRDGAFSHCGVDNFDMAKVDGRWKVLNISYTVETEGCRQK